MPLLGFNGQFSNKIISGIKRTTIRTHRVIPIKPGDILYMYSGLRTKNCKKIGQFKCISVKTISIFSKDIFVNSFKKNNYERDEIVRKDGFDSFEDMKMFFKLPFHGILIEWEFDL